VTRGLGSCFSSLYICPGIFINYFRENIHLFGKISIYYTQFHDVLRSEILDVYDLGVQYFSDVYKMNKTSLLRYYMILLVANCW
jgi:hypothetical protein